MAAANRTNAERPVESGAGSNSRTEVRAAGERSAGPVVIQKLVAFQRRSIADHLLRLSTTDRRLRFGMCLSDEAVRRYVERIDFACDEVFGIFGDGLTLIAVAHLAFDPVHACAEIGLSVDRDYRGRGYGHALLQRGRRHAIRRGCRTLYMHFLSENEAIRHLAAKAGLRVVMAQGEADAMLALPGPRHDDMARGRARERVTLADYRLKQQARPPSAETPDQRRVG
jgi:RimJ/RimL family protein N-acetyltransferase